MKSTDVFKAWGSILNGRFPSLSIEITRECPLTCPGCYAYEPNHLGKLGVLRQLVDYKGQALIDGILSLVNEHKPLHLSIVGGEPLVRFRELNVLLPILSEMGVAVQIVTSAVREIPAEWAKLKELYIVVSIDGLQPEHDARRSPATYQKILKNIVGHSVTIHCTITSQMTQKANYFEEFLSFWSKLPEIKKIWFSLFTPQVGAQDKEILSKEDRERVLLELAALRTKFPKLNLPDLVIAGYHNPPQSPLDCIFARTTLNITADLQNKITPCQFGGNPDCKQCGCIASAGLNAVGNYRLLGLLPVRTLYQLSDKIGKMRSQ
jgi:sulfatase maturation enzyme AslB (radical SAM superfamily)